jgi:large subunit ribosomal protein L30
MAEEKNSKKLAILLVRGRIGMNYNIKHTADLLKLFKKNSCVVLDDTPVHRGMAQKVKDFTTFGNIDEETYTLLVEKRGVKDEEGNVKNVFKLNPPRGGFERKGIKKPFTLGGALGERKDKMNDLIKRMI